MSNLCTNKIGGYATNGVSSRYDGIYFFEEHRLMKTIERIRCSEDRPEDVKINMPINRNSAIIQLTKKQKINLLLDIRDSYDSREWGRDYQIHKEIKNGKDEKGIVVITYTKKTDSQEDKTNDELEYTCYLAIKVESEANIHIVDQDNNYEEVEYPYDKRRGSKPSTRYVFNALETNAAELIIAFSFDKKKALNELRHLEKKKSALKSVNTRIVNSWTNHIKGKKGSENVHKAYISSVHAMNYLVAEIYNTTGIYAGLPWFFQFLYQSACTIRPNNRFIKIMSCFHRIDSILLPETSFNIIYLVTDPTTINKERIW